MWCFYLKWKKLKGRSTETELIKKKVEKGKNAKWNVIWAMHPKHTNDKEYLKKKVVSKNIYYNKQVKHEQKLRK